MSDLRNHPAINFFKSGIPIVLAGDDPGSFGYNDLTVDYYLAYMAWGLDLYDLKVIANNSIKYSSIPQEIKQIGYKKFEDQWNKFIDDAFQFVCSKRDKNSPFNVSNLFPAFGPANKQVELRIFGLGFERAICEKIWCLFNDLKVNAKMIGIGEFKCLTPIVSINISEKIELKILIGDSIYRTNFSYTFLKDNVPVIFDKTTSFSKNDNNYLRFQNFWFYPIFFSYFFYNILII